MSLVDQQNIIDAVYTAINTSIGSSVSVFENEAPQDSDLPVCTFSIFGDVPVYHMNDESLDCEVQVKIYGWKKNGSKEVRAFSSTLINDLDRTKIDITGYDNETIFFKDRGIITKTDDIIEIRLQFNLKGF
ncbi:MAG: hypothetical protein KAX49_15770 [Halanaerobiales bacterium]|nr:hypothetical protein [Halanaerobiales bacterium]